MDTLPNELNILELDEIARRVEVEREINQANEMIWESRQNAMWVLSDKPHRIPRKTPHTMTMPPMPNPPPRIITRGDGDWFFALLLCISIMGAIALILH